MKEIEPFPAKLRPFLLYLSRSKDVLSTEVYQLYVMVMVWGSTALLMWSYTANSILTVDNVYGLTYLSFVYSFLHLIAPFIYKIYPSITFCTYFFVVPGFCFQFHHSMATGGIHSSSVIWYSILPLIVGVTLNTRHFLLWTFFSFIGVLLQLYLTYFVDEKVVVDAITLPGKIWMQLNIALGYTVINLCLFLAYVKFRDDAFKSIDTKKGQIKNLLRILVHDLANPLSLIKVSANQVRNSPDSEKYSKQVQYLDLGLQSIEEIIQYVREYEALDSDKVIIDLGKTDLSYSLSISLLVFDSRLKEKQIQVINRVGSDIYILADKKVLISQVLNNLISNAIKFSNRGGKIEFYVSQNNDTVSLYVKDDGVGIDPKRIAKLFDETKVPSTLGTEGERGTGFGMPIIKMVMNKFQAKIEVQSSVEAHNHGTEFKLIFKKA